MKKLQSPLIIFFLLVFCFSCSDREASKSDQDLKLWYEESAVRWLDALPLGNGRLGAMVFGGVGEEHLGLNESTLWSGATDPNADFPEAWKHLDEVRALLFEEKFAEAEALISTYFFGSNEVYGTHLPMAELYLKFPHSEGDASNYRRELDLNDAVSRVEYTVGKVGYTRESFSSNPDQVIVLRLEADQKDSLEFEIGLDGGLLPHDIIATQSGQLAINGLARESHHSDGKTGVRFFGLTSIKETDGAISFSSNSVKVTGATYATLLVAANTSYHGDDPRKTSIDQIDQLKDFSYAELKERHIQDHSQLFSRVEIELGRNEKANLPTDQRLMALEKNPDDPQLYALFYQYARYLIIASSREDSPLPNNLQGIWNDHLASKMQWTCDFHLDINMQQNYWPVENGNLSECHEPLFKLIEGFQEPGARTAKNLYNSEGWVAHVITNAWGFTSPGWGLVWGLHVTGGTWIASHMWQRYEYTGDETFLRERAYPVLKGNVEFLLDYMVEHPDYGWLVTGPAISPENKFYGPDGLPHGESMGPTMDMVLIHELFGNVAEASEILGIDEEFRSKVLAAREKLPPMRVGKYGQLMEWLEDYEEAVPEHRCISQLVGLFPGSSITQEKTPELADAARVSMERRTSHPDWEDVEWSIGNLVNWYARLGEGEKAYIYLHELLNEHTDVDMLTYSRAGIAGAKNNIFVLDGNTSGASGISEMIIQSYEGKVYLLPALPMAWPSGSFKGVCTRGGFEFDLEWKDGDLLEVRVLSKLGKALEIICGDISLSMDTEAEGVYIFNENLEQI